MVGQHPSGDGVFTALASLLAAQQVGQPARGDRDQPTSRIVGDAILGPLQGAARSLLRRRSSCLSPETSGPPARL